MAKKEEKKKRKSASKPTTPLNQVRGAIGNRTAWGPLWTALESAKGDASTDEYNYLYGLASLSPMFGAAYPASTPIQKPAFVQAIARLEPVGFYRELTWACTALSFSYQRIKNFAILRDEYFALLAHGSFGSAILVLNKIDRAFGLSLWSVENRISLLAMQAGFENQKPFVRALTSNYKKTFLSFFATNISERNESRVSLRGFESRLRERARTWEVKADHLAYIFYKLLGVADDSLIGAANLIAHEGSSSAIDLYETILDMLCRVRSNPNIKREKVVASLDLLRPVDDHCVKNLLLAYSGNADVSMEVDRIVPQSYFDKFLQGDYEASAKETSRTLHEDPLDVSAVILSGQLRALGFECSALPVGLTTLIHAAFGNYFEHGQMSEAAAEELEKLALNFRYAPFASTIPLPTRAGSVSSLIPLSLATAVRNQRMTAQAFLTLVPDEQAGLKAVEPDSITWRFQCGSTGVESRADTLAGLSVEAVAYAELSYLLTRKRFEDALPSIAKLETAGRAYFNREARVLKAWALYNDGNFLESLVHSVKTTIQIPSLSKLLPLEAILRERGFRDLKQLQNELVLAIGFQIYMSRTADRSKEVALQVAWKQLLKHYVVEKPSQLAANASGLDNDEFVYFLRNVCVQEVMELGKAFGSPSDLDEERLQICVLLAQLDPKRVTDYDAEIIELTRRLSIEEGVNLVESSRVYVDVFGLERWAVTTLQEPFLRYMDYAAAGLQSSVEELERKLVEILRRGGKGKDVASFLDNYDVSADSILEELIEKSAHAFMSLPRYGLDAFLGSRVRHGSLEGAFRSPLEYRRLVTKIESSTGEYESNAYWFDLGAGDVQAQTKVDEALRRFSKGVDALIDSAVNRYVYVRTDANQDGLISLWANDDMKRQMVRRWVIDVKLHLTPDATVAEFLNHCVMTFFWPALTNSLAGMQAFVTGELAAQLYKLLQRLQDDICGAVFVERSVGFVNYVKAACHDIEAAAEKISKWFVTPRKPQHQLSFPLKTAIEIGLESTRRIRPQFDPVVSWNVEPGANVILRTAAFEVINDVSFLIFGNVSKHAGFPERGLSTDTRPGIDISITSREPDFIDIRVESDIGEDADESQITQNVEAAKATIAERRYDEVARRRRGTGLVRLASTLNYEGAEDKAIDFGVTETMRFFVYLSAPRFYFSIE